MAAVTREEVATASEQVVAARVAFGQHLDRLAERGMVGDTRALQHVSSRPFHEAVRTAYADFAAKLLTFYRQGGSLGGDADAVWETHGGLLRHARPEPPANRHFRPHDYHTWQAGKQRLMLAAAKVLGVPLTDLAGGKLKAAAQPVAN